MTAWILAEPVNGYTPRGGTAAFFPLTHALVGWCVAHLGRPDRATRLWCLVASLAPDLDGLGLLLGGDFYERYHHVLFHNLLFGVVVTGLSVRWIGLRVGPLALVFGAFLAHLVGDYLGSGPGWGISPYLPFSGHEYLFAGAWELASWQNTTITACAIGGALLIAARYGYTPLEFIHAGLDSTVVDTVQLRAVATACRWCATRAQFRCGTCREPLCGAHRSRSRLRPRCLACGVSSAAVS